MNETEIRAVFEALRLNDEDAFAQFDRLRKPEATSVPVATPSLATNNTRYEVKNAELERHSERS